MKNKLFIENPLTFFLDSNNIEKAVIGQIEIIYEENNQLLEYVGTTYTSKIDFTKGYTKIILNSKNYNEKFLKYNKIFCYNVKRICKVIKYGNTDSQHFFQYNLLNEKTTFLPDFDKLDNYKFITIIFYENQEVLNSLNTLGFTDYEIWFELTLTSREIVNTKENYNNKLSELKITKEKPRLLLHSCCGPCSSECLQRLYPYFKITIFYYNPNIQPFNEYEKRLNEQRKIISALNYDINIIDQKYDYNEFLDAIKGLNDHSEGGVRCFTCYEFRLEKTAKLAKELNFDYFTTTLSISPYKNANKINELGIALQEKYNMKFLYSNFKLNDGYKKSIELSKKYDLYRQDYCGCEYSMNFKKIK